MCNEFSHDDEYCDGTEDCGCFEDIYIYVIFNAATGEFVHMYEPQGSQYFGGCPSDERAQSFYFDPETYENFTFFKDEIISDLNNADYMWAQ
jgi:hypothetical protein